MNDKIINSILFETLQIKMTTKTTENNKQTKQKQKTKNKENYLEHWLSVGVPSKPERFTNERIPQPINYTTINPFHSTINMKRGSYI